MKLKFLYAFGYIFFAVFMFISCSTAPLSVISPTKTLPQPAATRITPTPTSVIEIENEIAAFMLDYLYNEYKSADAYGKENYPDVYIPITWLIVWGKSTEVVNPGLMRDYINLNQPIKVWLITKGYLNEVQDKEAALKEYNQQQIEIVQMQEHHQSREIKKSWWEYTEFSIISISEDGNNVRVFCDNRVISYIDTFQRNTSGQWEIINHEIAGYH